LLSGLALVGCAGGSKVYDHTIYHTRWPDFFAAGASDEISTRVWANPFEAPVTATETVVVEALAQARNNPGWHFTTQPQVEVFGRPYIGVLFNFPRGQKGWACADFSGRELDPPLPGQVTVLAAICRGGAPLAAVRGHADNVTGPDDPAFRNLMVQVGYMLFRRPFQSLDPELN